MRLVVAPSWSAPPPPWLKGRPSVTRETEHVDTLLAHQTDVRGGFGAPSLEGRIARWMGSGPEHRGVPYHYLYSPRDEAVIALRHPRVYTYHGNRANRYSVGFAVDGAWPGDPEHPGLVEEATELVLAHLAGQRWPVFRLEAHRQHSDQRGSDPGPELWAPIKRACARRGVVHSSRVTGTGRPVPPEWG